MIRVQRGDGIEEVSDGFSIVVDNVNGIRNGMLGQAARGRIAGGRRTAGHPDRE